jgi:hypothetical protein
LAVGELAAKAVLSSFKNIDSHYLYPAPSHHEEEDNDQYDEADDDEAEFGGCNNNK